MGFISLVKKKGKLEKKSRIDKITAMAKRKTARGNKLNKPQTK